MAGGFGEQGAATLGVAATFVVGEGDQRVLTTVVAGPLLEVFAQSAQDARDPGLFSRLQIARLTSV